MFHKIFEAALSGAVEGLILGVIASLIAFFKYRSKFKKCELFEFDTSIKRFKHRGKYYDYNAFLLGEAESYDKMSRASLSRKLKKLKKKSLLDEPLYEIELIATQAALYLKDNDVTFEKAIEAATEILSLNDNCVSEKHAKSKDSNEMLLTVSLDISEGKHHFIATKPNGGFVHIYPHDGSEHKKIYVKKKKTIKLNADDKIKLVNCELSNKE